MARTHGFTSVEHDGKYARVHRIWGNMLQRCYNPKNRRFKDYGARGIGVDLRWHAFENFLADMGLPPVGTTLDRVKNDKGYSKRNCRWANAFTQAQNSRRAINVTLNGETRCLSEWCRNTGISYGLYKARMKRGWTQERALLEGPANRGLRALRGKVLHIQED